MVLGAPVPAWNDEGAGAATAGAGVVGAIPVSSSRTCSRICKRICVIVIHCILPLVDVCTDFLFASTVYCSSECRYDNVLSGFFFETVFASACIGGLLCTCRMCAAFNDAPLTSYPILYGTIGNLCCCGANDDDDNSTDGADDIRRGFAFFNPLIEDIPQMLFVCIDIQASDGEVSFEAAASYIAALVCMIASDAFAICTVEITVEDQEGQDGYAGMGNGFAGVSIQRWFQWLIIFKTIISLFGLVWAMYWTVPIAYLFLSLPVFIPCFFLTCCFGFRFYLEWEDD